MGLLNVGKKLNVRIFNNGLNVITDRLLLEKISGFRKGQATIDYTNNIF